MDNFPYIEKAVLIIKDTDFNGVAKYIQCNFSNMYVDDIQSIGLQRWKVELLDRNQYAAKHDS